MKASNVSIDERYILELKQKIYDEFKRDCEQVIKDREMMAGCRAQWILLVAIYRALGIGKRRMMNVFEFMEELVPGLSEDREAEVMDEILIRDLEAIGLNIREVHAEYFEAAERLRAFGRFIDKEKEKAEAEKKEKAFLKRLNVNISVGRGRFFR